MEQKEINDKFFASPEDIIRNHAKDEDKTAIAKRPDLPEDLIRTLANDAHKYVRRAIAERSDLPEDLVRILAKDKFEEVRQAIANRESLPEDVLRTLINDEDTYVRKLIVQRKDLPKDIVRIPTSQEVLEQKVFDLLSTFPDKRLVFDRPLFVYSNPDPFDLSKMFANEIYIGTDYHCEKFTELHGKTTWGNELTNDDVAVRFLNYRNQEKYDEMMKEIGWVTTGNDAIIAQEMGLDPYNQNWPDGVGSKLFSDEYSQKGYEYNREILAKTVLKRIFAEKARIKNEAEREKKRELAEVFEKEHTGYVADESIKELFLVMREDYEWISDMECHSMSLHHFKTLKEATEYFNNALSEKNPDGRKIQGTEADFTNGLVIKGGGCNAMSLIKINREVTRTMEKDSSEFWNISPYESGGEKRKDALLKKYESGIPFTDKEIAEIRRSVLHEEPKQTNTFRERADRAISSGKLKSVGELRDGWALVQTLNGKYNYINEKGDYLIKNAMNLPVKAEPFNNGKARVTIGKQLITINTDGVVLSVTPDKSPDGSAKMKF